MHADAESAEFGVEEVGELALQRGEDVRGHLDDVDLESCVVEGFGCLQSDVAGAEDHRPPRTVVHACAQAHGIRHRAEGAHAVRVESRQGGPQGARAGGEDERVVGEGVDPGRRDDCHGPPVGLDRRHLVAAADVEVQSGSEGGRGVEEKRVGIGDLAADVVREAAVRERHLRSALEDDDLG